MACGVCGDVCVLIDEKCFCIYQPDGYKLAGNQFAVMMANNTLRDCIGDCIDKLCDAEDVTMDDVLERDDFKLFYAALIRYQIFCEKGMSQGSKAGETQWKGDEEYTAVNYATFNSKKKRLIANIALLQKNFLTWFDAQGYSCTKEEDSSLECGCNNTCGCSGETDLGFDFVRL